MRRHSSEISGGKFKCKHCLIYMTSKALLKHHIKVKHRNENEIEVGMILEGELLKCETCGGEFITNIDLRNHMKKIHSAKKAEKCKYCVGEYVENT